MSLASFSFPTPTLSGVGALAELAARLRQLNVRRPLVVTDPGLLVTEAFQKLQETLGVTGHLRCQRISFWKMQVMQR